MTSDESGSEKEDMSDEKSIRVLSFDGKIAKFRQWKVKFMAKASHGDYRGLWLGTENAPGEEEVFDKTTDEGKEKQRLRDANTKAFSALALACNGAAFGCVEAGMTTDFPNGSARKVWEQLLTRYEPSTKMHLVSLKKEFASTKLTDANQDPDECQHER